MAKKNLLITMGTTEMSQKVGGLIFKWDVYERPDFSTTEETSIIKASNQVSPNYY